MKYYTQKIRIETDIETFVTAVASALVILVKPNVVNSILYSLPNNYFKGLMYHCISYLVCKNDHEVHKSNALS